MNDKVSAQKLYFGLQKARRFKIFITIILITSIFVQKFAAPGSSGTISLNTALLPILILICFYIKVVVIDIKLMLLYFLFVIIGALSILINSAFIQTSLSSFLLVAVLQVSFITKVNTKLASFINFTEIFRNIMLFFGIIGIIQFFIQFLLGSNIAFLLDFGVDKSYFVAGFNNIIPLYYGSKIIKSNGFFFSEPSLFSQYVALAAILELTTRRNIIALCIFFFAIVCSYSGTGLIMVGLFGGYLVASRGHSSYFVLLAILALLIIIFGESLQLDIFTSRVNEFSTPGSSGYARFIAPFDMIFKFSFDGTISTVFGKGPGGMKAYEDSMPGGRLATSDPTWAKLIFEYGIAGTVVYAIFIFKAVSHAGGAIVFPLLCTYLFLGGYLANGAIIGLVLILLIWNRTSPVS